MKFLLIALAFVSLATQAATPCVDANKIYKVCSSQQKLYDTALADALSQHKLLLVTFGFEACPWCQSMHRIFLEPSSQKHLEAFTRVEIEAKNKSLDGKKVLATLEKADSSTKAEGFPFLAIVNPANKKVALLNTDALEQNTETTKGHNPEKIFAALEKASQKIK